MKKLLRIFILASIGILTLNLYSDPGSKIKKIGESTFISDVEGTLKSFKASGKKYGVIPKELWADSIMTFSPKKVMTFQRGVLIITKTADGLLSGIYVVFESPGTPPSSSSGVSFKKIANRIYTADLQIRKRK